MAFCQNCGQQLPEGANACPNCGTFVNAQAQPAAPPQPTAQAAPQQPTAQATPQQPTAQAAPQQNYQQAPQQGAPVNPTVMGDPDVQQNRGIAWLSYVGLLFLVPMFAKKDSPYCQYHVKQGATLCAVDLVYTIVTRILLAIINAIFPGKWNYLFYTSYYSHSAVYNIFNFLFIAGTIFLCVISIIGIVNAATGKKKELLLIGKIPWIANLLDKFYNKA
jgi:hypothetical protein